MTSKIDISACARCGGNHSEVVIHRFANPAENWSHWAMCPNVQEPILIKVVVNPR